MKPPKNFRPEPYEYHHELDLRIENIAGNGSGIARHDGWVIFVPLTIPGETIRARIFRNHANYSEADCLEILEPAPERVEPQCPLFGECGGCQYQHVDYAKQLEWKRQHVVDSLSRIGGIDIEVRSVIPCTKPYGYRSKLTPHFQGPHKGALGAIGFLKRGSSRSIIDVPNCPIATEAINQSLATVRDYARTSWKQKRGGTLLLRETEEGVTTHPNNLVTQRVGTLTYQFKAGEFFQTNPFLLPRMVAHVVDQATHEGCAYLVDSYCGGGLFALAAAKRFQQCAGVEISRESVQLAEQNAEFNDVSNCSFLVGSASNIFGQIDFPGRQTSLIIDPPRRGCDPEFLNQILAFRPARVVYVSCDPATQARDLKALTQSGYAVVSVQPFDMFPQTRHIENIVTLTARPNLAHSELSEAIQ